MAEGTIPAQNSDASRVERKLPAIITKEVHESFREYFNEMIRSQTFRAEMHENLERVDREYNMQGNYEQTHLKAKAENAAGKKEQIQDLTIPVMYPQIESALAYLSGVFLSGYPIFGLVSNPVTAKIADQMEALMADHETRGGWKRHLQMFLRDSLKYNFGACEVNWEKKTSFSLENNSADLSGRAQRAKNIFWEGNCIKRIDPYNVFFDPRVPIAEIHSKGEFAGYTEIYSRIRLKQFVQDLPEAINLKEAFESDMESSENSVIASSPGTSNLHYVPQITDKLNPEKRDSEFNWARYLRNLPKTSSGINYRDCYEITTIYARILPADFKLNVPAKKTVQIWKLVWVNGKHLIYAERMTNAHDFLPMLFAQPNEDGLGHQSLSPAEHLLPIQNITSSLWKIRMAAARRNVSDRLLYDPTRIREEDINSNNPAAKIPVRNTGYNKTVADAVYQFPFRDQSSESVVRDTMTIADFGRQISGINRAQQGEFIKGNRTLGEYEDITGNADARLQILAQFLEAQFFTPLKEILKINILQYQPGGNVYSAKAKGAVQISPTDLRSAIFEFKVTDGVLPSAKIANTKFLQIFMQTIMTQPALMQIYDVGKMLAYMASLQNIPDLENFLLAPQNPAAAAAAIQQQQRMENPPPTA